MTPKFHVFYTVGKLRKIVYAYDVTFRSVKNAILKDPPREKHLCPALVLNRFKEDNEGAIRNRYELLHFTSGYFALDADNTGRYTELIKKELFRLIPSIKIVWISSSGKGVKAIGYDERLKFVSPAKHREVHATICDEIRKRLGLRINFDATAGRAHQPIFLNSDKKALVR